VKIAMCKRQDCFFDNFLLKITKIIFAENRGGIFRFKKRNLRLKFVKVGLQKYF